ncbi:Teneurin-2, partial [Blomia tropicalis]
MDPEPPLIPESQLFMSGIGSNGPMIDGVVNGWKSQHSTLEFGHLQPLQSQSMANAASQNTTILSTLDSTTNGSNGTTTTTTSANMAPVYESTCLMRTASGSLYIPSDNKGAFLTQKPLQSINEFTIGGTLKKPDRLPPVGTNSHSHFGRPIGSHLTGSRFAFRKVLSLQCNWKYVAIAFMLVTMALFIAITYIM